MLGYKDAKTNKKKFIFFEKKKRLIHLITVDNFNMKEVTLCLFRLLERLRSAIALPKRSS
jgi:hypothetical protein